MLKRHARMPNALLVHVSLRRRRIEKYNCMSVYLVPGLQNPGGANTGMTNMYLMLAIWFAIALLLFLFRPRALRNNRDTLGKPRNQV